MHRSRHPDVLKDYCDGQVANDHGLFSVHANSLLYYDDAEVVNPIGSHRKIHKLGKFNSISNQ